MNCKLQNIKTMFDDLNFTFCTKNLYENLILRAFFHSAQQDKREGSGSVPLTRGSVSGGPKPYGSYGTGTGILHKTVIHIHRF
jgi:hypothetical protein